MRNLTAKFLRILSWPARMLAQPWINKKIIKEVETQMVFWHRIELEALKAAVQCEMNRDYDGIIKYHQQAQTARLRCNKEMKKLPYRRKLSKTSLSHESKVAQKHRPDS